MKKNVLPTGFDSSKKKITSNTEVAIHNKKNFGAPIQNPKNVNDPNLNILNSGFSASQDGGYGAPLKNTPKMLNEPGLVFTIIGQVSIGSPHQVNVFKQEENTMPNLTDKFKKALSGESLYSLTEICADIVFNQHPNKSYKYILGKCLQYLKYSEQFPVTLGENSKISHFEMELNYIIRMRDEKGIHNLEDLFVLKEKLKQKFMNRINQNTIK